LKITAKTGDFFIRSTTTLDIQRGVITTIKLVGFNDYNVLDGETIRELSSVLSDLKDDPQLRVLILTGSGDKAFSSGANMRELASLDVAQVEEYVRLGSETYLQIENFPCPVIAVINGFAFGAGFELTLACDLRFMAKETRIGQPAVRHGLLPPFGGTRRLAQIIGLARAKEFLFAAMEVDAETALSLGIVNRIYPKEVLTAESLAFAEKIVNNKKQAVAITKASINAWANRETPDNNFELDVHGLATCLKSEETKKQLLSFFAKKTQNNI